MAAGCDPAKFESTFSAPQFADKATFVLGDADVMRRPSFSTGYVPTILLVEGGQIKDKWAGNSYSKIYSFIGVDAPGRWRLRGWWLASWASGGGPKLCGFGAWAGQDL